MLEDHSQSNDEFHSSFRQVQNKAAALNVELLAQKLDAGAPRKSSFLPTASSRGIGRRNERKIRTRTYSLNHLAGESVNEDLECDSGVWVSDSTLFRDTSFEVSYF